MYYMTYVWYLYSAATLYARRVFEPALQQHSNMVPLVRTRVPHYLLLGIHTTVARVTGSTVLRSTNTICHTVILYDRDAIIIVAESPAVRPAKSRVGVRVTYTAQVLVPGNALTTVRSGLPRWIKGYGFFSSLAKEL